jgi:3-oxoacyl-[acyl-carrier protein] reductase
VTFPPGATASDRLEAGSLSSRLLHIADQHQRCRSTKAALLNLTASLAKHLNRTGITVNTVSPGIVVTPGVEKFYRLEATRRGWAPDWPAIEAAVLAEVLDNPTGRLGRPDEVADLVAFVSSPLAGYINGANLRIDGGSTAVI